MQGWEWEREESPLFVWAGYDSKWTRKQVRSFVGSPPPKKNVSNLGHKVVRTKVHVDFVLCELGLKTEY